MQARWIVLLSAALVIAGIGLGMALGAAEQSDDDLIRDYYKAEYLIKVSPQTIKQRILADDAGGYLLVDLRAKEDYAKEHARGAINIPGNDETAKVIEAFGQLPKDKEIITYCYSQSCTLAIKAGYVLSQSGIYVKHLNIGWKEWNEGANTPELREKFIESGMK
jgi:rhodanese-related sulfurtransferase